MDLNSRKLNLHACLEKLVKGMDVEANVYACVENMSSLFKDIDAVLITQRQREKTAWTQAALEQASMDRIGNYRMYVHDTKKSRTVSFAEDGVKLLFIFEHKPYNLTDHFGAAVLEAAQNQNPLDQTDALKAIEESVLRVGAGMSEKSPDEIRLGRRPQALNQYELTRVCLETPREGRLASFIKLMQTKTLYTSRE